MSDFNEFSQRGFRSIQWVFVVFGFVCVIIEER